MSFYQNLYNSLKRHLETEGLIDSHFPECIDVEEYWPAIEKAYMPDGLKEFAEYPVSSIGWPMFIGMAMAKFWDTDWTKYSTLTGEQIYQSLRDARGYDTMDDYILEDILGLPEKEASEEADRVGKCASIAYHDLMAAHIQPSTAQALEAYRDTIKALYMMGVAMELKSLGYKMTKMGE